VGDDHITVQHILIGFKDAVGFQGRQMPEKAASRTQEDARKLAYDLLARAEKGEDFDTLVKEYTDDSPPGIYNMSNNGVAPASEDEFPRSQLVPAFGDVGFGLKMNEIGIADYDPNTSPFGYHVIKRVAPPPPPQKPAGEDDRITVQHILIGFADAVGFQGQVPEKAQGRTQEQAKTLAYEILDRAKKGEDFDKLVEQYTDDSPPGIYSLANIGVQADQASGEYGRKNMVPAFGDVGFKLKVGDIGIADYDPTTSPYGWHIIKRVK
jgi:parvulin-like peptidyl-prolyl isomerase